VNAVEESLRSSPETAGKLALSSTPPPAANGDTVAAPSERLSFEGKMLRRLLSFLGEPPIEFVLWNGERISVAGANIVSRVRIEDRATLYGILRDPQMRFGDAYSEGKIQIEGDLVRLLEEVYRAGGRARPRTSLLRKVTDWLNRPRSNTLDGSRENIHHHYDIGNDFYSLWLGQTMAYTCAYYPTDTATLDEAQTAKMHHICRKLQLKPGESVVEAGCGWGTLALHMARHYGVKVRAFNISKEQVAYARERAKAEGLAGLVEYVQDDYRTITGRYDAFVSVGMLEHVGVENYPELGRIARQCLPAHGRGLIHSIGRNIPRPLHPWIERRIFPGAYPPTLREFMQIFEPWGFSILDVENIRLHYAKTCTHWLDLYEAASSRVRDMFDEKFVRMWRLYLAGSVAGFTTGTLQLFQVVFAPPENNNVPMTRAHLYAS
jgi:cyclopropane-fatty-acyl-phospholipid synthase